MTPVRVMNRNPYPTPTQDPRLTVYTHNQVPSPVTIAFEEVDWGHLSLDDLLYLRRLLEDDSNGWMWSSADNLGDARNFYLLKVANWINAIDLDEIPL